jgi:hypothetical protein
MMDEHTVDISILIETWKQPPANKNSQDLTFASNQFFCFIDLTNTNGRRGIQIVTRNHLEPLLIPSLQRHTEYLEALAIKVHHMILIAAYIPDGTIEEGITELLDLLQNAIDLFPESIIVATGDWNTRSKLLGNKKTNLAGRLLDRWLPIHQEWHKHHSSVATCTKSQEGSIIDLTLIYNEDILPKPVKHQATNDFALSDHTGQLLNITSPRTLPTPDSTHFKRPKMQRVNAKLHKILQKTNQLQLQDFIDAFNEEFTYQSQKKIAVKEKQSHSDWYKPSKRAQNLFRRLKRAQRHKHHEADYKNLRTEYQKLVRTERRQQFEKHLTQVEKSSSIKELFTLLRRTKPRQKWNANIASGREEELLETVIPKLNTQQQTRYTAFMRQMETQVKKEQHWNSTTRSTSDFRLDINTYSWKEFQALLKSLPKGKAPGPDGITYEMIQQLDQEIQQWLLTSLKQIILRTNIPEELLTIKIKPLPKTPGQEAIRPISLINIFLKLADRIFLTYFRQWLQQTKLIFEKQYGFQRGKSSQDQIARLLDDILSTQEEGKVCCIISLDLEKAYDRVNLQTLYNHLRLYNVPKAWVPYIYQLLFKRKGYISSRSSNSTIRPIQRGIPQGLSTAPLLFNIYVNATLLDIDELADETYPFADDNSLLIVKDTYQEIYASINNLIPKLQELYSEIEANLSLKKSLIIPIGTKHTRQRPKRPRLPINEKHKILGILLDRRLRFKEHCDQLRYKFYTRLLWLQSMQPRLNLQRRLNLFKTFCMSLLEYSIPIIESRLTKSERKKLDSLIAKGLRFIARAPKTIGGDILHAELGIPNTRQIAEIACTRRLITALRQLETCSHMKRQCQIILELQNRNAQDLPNQDTTNSEDPQISYQTSWSSPLFRSSSSADLQKWLSPRFRPYLGSPRRPPIPRLDLTKKSCLTKLYELHRTENLNSYALRFPMRATRFAAK